MYFNIVIKNRYVLCSDLFIINMYVKLLYFYKGGKVFNFKFFELFYNRSGIWKICWRKGLDFRVNWVFGF